MYVVVYCLIIIMGLEVWMYVVVYCLIIIIGLEVWMYVVVYCLIIIMGLEVWMYVVVYEDGRYWTDRTRFQAVQHSSSRCSRNHPNKLQKTMFSHNHSFKL